MAKLIITRDSGVVEEYDITPAIEVAKKGIFKALTEDQKQTDVYYLCWEAIRRSGQTVPVFGDEFLKTLKSVEVGESDPLGG